MILLDNLHYLLLLAITVFTLALYTKIYINIRNIEYSFKGIIYFLLIAISFPFTFSNDVHKRRKALIRKINSDNTMTESERAKMKRFINSKIRLYISFTGLHILDLPKFIDDFSTTYAKWYKNKIVSNKENRTKVSKSPLQEIKKLEVGKFPEILKTMKEKLI